MVNNFVFPSLALFHILYHCHWQSLDACNYCPLHHSLQTTIRFTEPVRKTQDQSDMTGSLQAFFSETFVNLITVYIIFSHPARHSRDIPSQEANYISKTKSPNKKMLLSSVLCSLKFSITMVCFYLTFGIIGFLAIFTIFVVFCSLFVL